MRQAATKQGSSKRKAADKVPAHERIKPDPHNARIHPERNQAMIRESLNEVGPLRSIGLDANNVVRVGNGVFEQAKELGLKVRIVDAQPDELIAVRRKDLKGRKAERAALYDNRAGELAEWNTDVIREMHDHNPKLLEGIFTDAELKLNLAGLAGEKDLEDVEFQAYDEGAADEVQHIECPKCKYKFVPD